MNHKIRVFGVLLLSLMVLVSGCDSNAARRGVGNAFPGTKVQPVPGCKYQWLIYDGTNVWYVFLTGGPNGVKPEYIQKGAIKVFP